MSCLLASLSFIAAMSVAGVQQDAKFGEPRIARYWLGAKGAVSLQFDDSMISQLENALPLLKQRGLRATFFVNPARPQYKAHLKEWESDVPKLGNELANHTLSHTGAKNAEEADAEIGACSMVLQKIEGPKLRLRTFGQPGGVPWDVTPDQLAPIFEKYLLVPSTNRVFFDEKDTDPVTIAQKALDDGSWIQLGMHGTGGEWLSTSIPTLTRVLDFLVSHRSDLWCAPTIEVYKYIQERDAARKPVLSDVSAKGFTIDVRCDPGKLHTFRHPVSELYDQPLTVEVPVPSTWTTFAARQGSRTVLARTRTTQNGTIAWFDVLPDKGPVRVEAK